MKKFMESLLKNSIDDESTFYIEITSILTYVVAQLITSVITVLYFKASGSFHIGFIWQFINIFILSICGYCILKNGTSCTAMWVFVIYNFSVFSIMWYFFSFSHQLVIVFYSYYTILNIIILSERMTLAKFIIISNVGSVLLIFDLIFRPEMKIQSDLWVTLIVFVLYQSIYVITYIQIRGYRKLVRSTYLRTLIDPLTKVGNSCAFYKDIDFILSLSSRTGEEFQLYSLI